MKETECTVSHLWRNHPDSAYSTDEVGDGILSLGLGSSVTPYSISLDALGLSPLPSVSELPTCFPPYLLNEPSLAHLRTIDFANFSHLLGAVNSHGCWVQNLTLLVLRIFCFFFVILSVLFRSAVKRSSRLWLRIRRRWSWHLSLGSSSEVTS